MPHRKLVKIGETPKLPTIEQFFQEMAVRQHDEIRKLKEELAGHAPGDPADFGPHDPRKPVPDPWLLHPTRIKRTPAKRKASKKASAGKPKSKRPAKKTAARTSKRVSSKRSSARKSAKRK